MSSFWHTYSNPTDRSFLISSLLLVAVTLYSSSLLSPNIACSTCMYNSVFSRLACPRYSFTRSIFLFGGIVSLPSSV